MTDYFETKSQPIRDELVHPMKILHYLCVIYKHEEPCEGRLSRTVLWEGWGEIPLPDPIITAYQYLGNLEKVAQYQKILTQ